MISNAQEREFKNKNLSANINTKIRNRKSQNGTQNFYVITAHSKNLTVTQSKHLYLFFFGR